MLAASGVSVLSRTELCQVSAHPAGAGVPSGQDEPTAGRVWMWNTHTAPGGTRRLRAKQGAGQRGAMPAPPEAWLPLLEPLPAGIFPGILPGTLGPCLQPATCHQCPQHVLTRARARLPLLLLSQPRSSPAPGPAAPGSPRGHPAVPRPPCHGHHSQPALTWSPCHLDPGMSHTGASMPNKIWQGSGMRLLLCTVSAGDQASLPGRDPSLWADFGGHGGEFSSKHFWMELKGCYLARKEPEGLVPAAAEWQANDTTVSG